MADYSEIRFVCNCGGEYGDAKEVLLCESFFSWNCIFVGPLSWRKKNHCLTRNLRRPFPVRESQEMAILVENWNSQGNLKASVRCEHWLRRALNMPANRWETVFHWIPPTQLNKKFDNPFSLARSYLGCVIQVTFRLDLTVQVFCVWRRWWQIESVWSQLCI